MRCILILLVCVLQYCLSAAAEQLIVLQGQITETSPLPDPKQAPYPDCDYAIKLVYLVDKQKKEVVVIMPGFRERKLCQEASFINSHDGFYEFTLCDFWDAPELDRSRQVVNTIDADIADVYFMRKLKRISSVGQNKNTLTAKKDVVKLQTHPPKPAAVRQARSEAMAQDISAIKQLFAQHGGSLEQWEKELAPVWKSFKNPTGQAPLKVAGQIVSPLQFDVKSRTLPKAKHYGRTAAQALIQLNKLLKQQNIDLIVVPFPDGYDMAFEHFCSVKSSDGFVKPKDLAFMLDLLQNDVEIINLYPELLREQKKYPLFYNYPDYHPVCYSYDIAADKIARRLQRYQFDLTAYRLPKTTIRPIKKQLVIDGKIESFPLYRVDIPPQAPEAPYILIAGDSFMHGISPFLTRRLAFKSTQYYKNGGAFEMLRFLTVNAQGINLLVSRPVCLFIFDMEHLRLQWCEIPQSFTGHTTAKHSLPASVTLSNLQRSQDQFKLLLTNKTTANRGYIELSNDCQNKELSIHIEPIVISRCRIMLQQVAANGQIKTLQTLISSSGPDQLNVKIPATEQKIRLLFEVNNRVGRPNPHILFNITLNGKSAE